MSNKRRRERAEKAKRKRSSKVWVMGAVLGGLMVLGSFFFLGRGEPWGLPGTPRNPRPETLSPVLFTGKVAKAYQIAREAPELLERMPCYCGCYVTDRHQNNLDCYTDRHGAG